MTQRFQTDFRYTERESKAEYVARKYREILQGASILDVGADECYLRRHLGPDSTYTGIGLGGNPDRIVNLEQERIPFPDDSFDCVLCLDVLEHIDNPHETLDELCRVSRRYVIVSLPNPWGSFWRRLRMGESPEGKIMKFYGLPVEKPEDRHKWFFSATEAQQFIRHRAEKNGMQIVQMDFESVGRLSGGVRGRLRRAAAAILLAGDYAHEDLYASTLWAVLEKKRA